MAKKISMTLSRSSINDAINELKAYKKELIDKNELFVQRLLQVGVETSQVKLAESPLGRHVTISTDISSDRMGCKGILLAKGTVKQNPGYAPFSILLAIEFGAGIHYNPTPNPKADELGLGVGTFPGQTHALDSGGWMYWDEDLQEWRHSYGVKATMPLYNADIEMIQNIMKIANEVFS